MAFTQTRFHCFLKIALFADSAFLLSTAELTTFTFTFVLPLGAVDSRAVLKTMETYKLCL